jgi:hypothetical protein
MNPMLVAGLERLLLAAITNGPALLKTGQSIGELAVGIVQNIKNDNPDFGALHAKIEALQDELDAPLPLTG